MCITCKKSKSVGDFYKHPTTKDGLLPSCKECQKNYVKNRNIINPDIGKQARKRYYNKNKEKHKKWADEWRNKNPEKVRENKRRWDRKAMQNPMHRLSNNLRGNMYHALKSKKGFRKWEDLVGYTLQDLINHITPLLNKNAMNWDNYGSVWHVDHVIPKSWFKYSSTDDPKFKECWALSNLQPKLKTDNIRKGNKFVG